MVAVIALPQEGLCSQVSDSPPRPGEGRLSFPRKPLGPAPYAHDSLCCTIRSMLLLGGVIAQRGCSAGKQAEIRFLVDSAALAGGLRGKVWVDLFLK